VALRSRFSLEVVRSRKVAISDPADKGGSLIRSCRSELLGLLCMRKSLVLDDLEWVVGSLDRVTVDEPKGSVVCYRKHIEDGR
jgi:hypothetical protein